MAKDVPWKSCGNWWNSPKCLAGPIPDKINCSVLANSTAALVNGTAALVNGTATLANTTVSNCTSSGVSDYTSPPLEYWE